MRTWLRPRLSNWVYVLPWLTLAVLVYFIYLELFVAPYLGFNFAPTSGSITEVHVPHSHLAVGDELLAVGPTGMAEWQANLRLPLFPAVKPGDHLALQVRHDGQVMAVDWVIPPRRDSEVFNRIVNIWPLGLAFWAAGAATLLFVRPRDRQYWLFAAFFLLTAVWLVIGNTNRWGLGESRVLFRMAVWLVLPVLLHVHWVFPQPLTPLPNAWLGLGYGGSVLAAGLQWFEAVPPALYAIVFSGVLLLCLVLLVVHFIRRRAARRAVGILLLGFLSAFVPLIGLSALNVGGFANEYTAAALLFLPLMPAAYFYVVFRHRLGGAELRANRLLATYLFVALLALVTTLAVGLVGVPFTGAGAPILLTLGVTLVSGAATFAVYPAFARGIERRLFGMPLPPESVMAAYLARISTSLSPGALTALLCQEVLPSLLVRQSALFTVRPGGLDLFYAAGVTPAAPEGLVAHFAAHSSYQSPPDAPAGVETWVRVALPLRFDGKLTGVWLLGRRDPDDVYGAAELALLKNLAAQTAIALVNIEQSATLHALYASNVSRLEAERRELAHRLHDEVLNRLALLYNTLDDAAVTPAVAANYDRLKADVRRMIAGLRPPMLDYGLPAALDALVDELTGRTGSILPIELAVPAGEARHPSEVEEQIFRIVQQAAENALVHAGARRVRIYGEITATQIQLCVADDGRGFDVSRLASVPQLLADRHYGIVGMRERAASIGADLALESVPGRGTVVQVTWQAAPVPQG